VDLAGREAAPRFDHMSKRAELFDESSATRARAGALPRPEGRVEFQARLQPRTDQSRRQGPPYHKIMKAVAGAYPETLDTLANLYGSIIQAGIHRASSIKVAKAAKVIESTQRDVNIALMDEISKVFDLVGIRTSEVLEAPAPSGTSSSSTAALSAATVSGPIPITAKAEQLGCHPQVILSVRPADQ